MRMRIGLAGVLALLAFWAISDPIHAQTAPKSIADLKLVDIGPTGIDIKRPVFAGACKACPWGILAMVTKEALKPQGYDVQICFICWSNFGPRQMADKTKPTIPPTAGENLAYVEAPPDAVPDISATSETNLINAWNGKGPYAPDK